MAEDLSEPAEPIEPPMLVVRPNGSLVYDSIVVGRVDNSTLVLNLGWARAAGLGVRVEADPAVDHKRGGIVLARPAG